MKKFYLSAAFMFVLAGCGHQPLVSTEAATFNPDIQVQSSDKYHLVSNVTSTQPWGSNSSVHALAKFSQTQVWNAPTTTDVAIDYPYLTENTDAAIAFNNYVRDLVADEVSSFLSQLPTSVDEDWSDMPNELTISSNILTVTPTFISVDFAVSPYFAGAAHPGLYYRTVNFDLSSESDLGLADMFNNPDTDLATVQDAVVPRLVTFLNQSVDNTPPPFSADEEWIQTGTAPSSTNYMNIALTSEGLHVQFDPYQVAAYAMGAPDVTVQYSELNKTIKPGLLNHLGLN